MFIDHSKAFDTGNHKVLITKLEHYGVKGTNLQWLKSYPENRKQLVTYEIFQVLMQHFMWCAIRLNSWTIILSSLYK